MKKIPCITVVSEYRGKCDQPQKSLPRRALEIGTHSEKKVRRKRRGKKYTIHSYSSAVVVAIYRGIVTNTINRGILGPALLREYRLCALIIM